MTAVHYGLDPIAPARLYDLPEPRLKLTPRMAAAAIAVSLVYVGGGMALNMVGIEFVIPRINDTPIEAVVWIPPAPEVPVERPLIEPAHTLDTLEAKPTLPATETSPLLPATESFPAVGPLTTETVTPVEINAPVAPPPPPAPPQIRNPTWMQKPTGDQLARLYPKRAATRGIGGSATLDCRVTVTGSVNACVVLRESPAGYGFGEAALASSRYFKLNPRTVDGQVIEGAKVQIPMGFNLAE